LEELIEVIWENITGDSIFEKFGNEFPLLIKFIEAQEDLSIPGPSQTTNWQGRDIVHMEKEPRCGISLKCKERLEDIYGFKRWGYQGDL